MSGPSQIGVPFPSCEPTITQALATGEKTTVNISLTTTIHVDHDHCRHHTGSATVSPRAQTRHRIDRTMRGDVINTAPTRVCDKWCFFARRFRGHVVRGQGHRSGRQQWCRHLRRGSLEGDRVSPHPQGGYEGKGVTFPLGVGMNNG